MTSETSNHRPALKLGPPPAPAARRSPAMRCARSSCRLLRQLTALFAVATCSAIVLTSPRFHLTADAMASTTASPWTVSVAPVATGPALTPGSAPQSIAFSVTSSGADETLTQITAALASDRVHHNVEDSDGAAIPGCRASWFSAAPAAWDPPLPVTFTQAGETYSGRVEIRMLNRMVEQGSCRGQAPAVTVTAGSSSAGATTVRGRMKARWASPASFEHLPDLDPQFP
jgi:hypothetical protein